MFSPPCQQSPDLQTKKPRGREGEAKTHTTSVRHTIFGQPQNDERQKGRNARERTMASSRTRSSEEASVRRTSHVMLPECTRVCTLQSISTPLLIVNFITGTLARNTSSMSQCCDRLRALVSTALANLRRIRMRSPRTGSFCAHVRVLFLALALDRPLADGSSFLWAIPGVKRRAAPTAPLANISASQEFPRDSATSTSLWIVPSPAATLPNGISLAAGPKTSFAMS